MAIDQNEPAPLDDRKERARAKARARKQRFDARMRNAGASSDAVRRHALVVYLTDDARKVLQSNRRRRRLLELPPVLDSTLIEELLRAYRAQGEPEVTAELALLD